MTGVCKICNSGDQNVLFNVPKDERKRKIWSKACKMPLTSTSLICEKHFKLDDFFGNKNVNSRLKRNAVPFIDAATAKIKEEAEVGCSNEDEYDPLTLIKVENAEPINLIHEEYFDEHNRINEIEQSLSSNEDHYLTCGHILMELVNESFKLHCKHCETAFGIVEGQNFVKHIKEFHSNILSEKKRRSLGEKKCDTLNFKTAENIANRTELKLEFEEDQSSFDIDDDCGQHDNSNNTDEDYPPNAKKGKETKSDEKLENANIMCIELSKNKAKKDEANMVTFDTQPRKYIISFLELIKSNAILWHRRQSILKRFDDTLAEVLATFNKLFPNYQLTDESARLSLYRIKEIYQRVTDPNHKRHIKSSAHKIKFPEFFEFCSAIEVNSKKVVYSCKNCRAFFFKETDLQVHEVKTHRIGELPFKCSRCSYGFTKAEKRDEHEAKHSRARDFVCETCNRGFDSEEKLHAHLVIHSDDRKPVCEKCGQLFSNYNKYRRHKLRHEAPKEKCEICGKLFFEKWNLSEHIKSHLNERGYNCDVCGKSFNHQNDVTIHKRGVHNIKPQPRRARWVKQSESTPMHENKSKEGNKELEESSNDSQNVYRDNYDFRPMFEKEY